MAVQDKELVKLFQALAGTEAAFRAVARAVNAKPNIVNTVVDWHFFTDPSSSVTSTEVYLDVDVGPRSFAWIITIWLGADLWYLDHYVAVSGEYGMDKFIEYPAMEVKTIEELSNALNVATATLTQNAGEFDFSLVDK